MILYKYRSDSEYTEQIFSSGKVFLSTAEGLNDPFECSLQEIGKEWIQDKIKEMKTAGVSGFLLTAKRALDDKLPFFGLNHKETLDVLEVIKHKSLDEAYEFYSKFIKEKTGHPPSNNERLFSQLDAQLLSVGIFSMSTKPDHPLMWAHYSGDHYGICIGFNKTENSRLNNSDHCLPVIYSDELPELDGQGFIAEMAYSLSKEGRMYTSSFKIAFSDKTFQKAITTKPTCWKYEEEWRYIEPNGGTYDWPGEIAEVTFGLRMSEERIGYYLNLIESNIPNSVKLFQIRKRRNTNELERVTYAKSESQPKVKIKISEKQDEENVEMSLQEFAAKMERLIREEKYGEALFQIDENLKYSPLSPILLHLKGVAHGYAQEPVEALKCFKKLTELFPNIAQGWYQMGCAQIELNDHLEAVKSLRKAYALDPNDPSIPFNLGIELLKTQNDPDEALVYLKRADSLGHRRAFSVISEIEKAE